MRGTPKRKLLLALIAVTMFLPALAFAEETANSGDTAWMLVSTALVFVMFPGLAFFYAGMVRSKNVLSSCMHTFAAMAFIGVQWVVLGYTLAFGGAGSFIGGLDHLFLNGITPESLTGTIPTLVFVMFQGMFAIITPCTYFRSSRRADEIFDLLCFHPAVVNPGLRPDLSLGLG